MTTKQKFQCLLITLLLFPFKTLSGETEVNNLENFYVKASYFGIAFDNIGPFSGKENAGRDITEGIFSFGKNGQIKDGYSPQYTSDFSGSIAIGYLFNGVKVEFEQLTSQVNLYNEDYSDKNRAHYVELSRNEATSVGTKCESPWRSGKIDIIVQEKCVEAQFKAAFKMKNEGFYNLARLVNVYYDFNLGDMQFTPYASIGGGVTRVKFLGRTKYAPAYQAKLGVNYTLTNQAQIFSGLHYFGILGNEFKNIVSAIKIQPGEEYTSHESKKKVDETARIESTTATINNRFGMYGLEFGLAYHF